MKLIRPMIITGLLLSALPAFAQTTVTAELPKDGAKQCAGGKCGFDSKLKITPEQKAKLSSLHDQFKLSTADKKAELEVAHSQLRRLFSQPTIDKGAALALQGKINGLRDDLSTSKLNMMLASSDIFTPEQREAFSKMRAMRGMHGGHGKRHGHGGHHRGGGEGFRGGDKKVG